jgi:succinylglutamic semialdehyde dehydrogenase
MSEIPRGDYIDGEFRPSLAADGELIIASPADLDDEVSRHPITLSHVDDAVEAARKALPAYRRLDATARAALLLRYRAAVITRRERLADVIAREAGKPLWEARAEVDAVASKIDVVLGEGARVTETRDLPDVPGRVEARPLGVLAVIGPYNFPAHLPNGQIVPALALGNTVVVKPSERAPSACTLLAECAHEAGFPAGVFNVVQGARDSSAKLSAHDGIDGVLFTGSYAVGRAIVAANASRPERLIALELGGKNVALVEADADVERAARLIAFAAFATAGQRCTATSLCYVHRSIEAELSDRIAVAARTLRVGHVLDGGVFMGPVITADARARISDALGRARAAGYDALVAGGETEVAGRRGHYLRPSVHRARDASTWVAGYTDEELFGPDLAVHPVDDLEEAVGLANAGKYGLAASIFTARAGRFDALAADLEVGVVHHNRSSAGATGRLPFGGVKRSGNHRPGGISMGASCAFSQALYLEPAPGGPLPSWPGLFDG